MVSTYCGLYVTRDRPKGVSSIFAEARGKEDAYSITVKTVNSMPPYYGRSSLRAVIEEIPENGRGQINGPGPVFNNTSAVTNDISQCQREHRSCMHR